MNQTPQTPQTPGDPGPDGATFCYLLLCHTDRDLLLRTAARIRQRTPGATVVLRHDRGDGFVSAADAAAVGARVLQSTIGVDWGGWSMIEAEVEALQRLLTECPPHVGWFVVVSGHDYPVRDLQAWEAEVRASGCGALVHAAPRPDHPRYRYSWRHLPGWVTSLPAPLTQVLLGVWRRTGARWQQHVVLFQVARTGTWLLGRWRARTPLDVAGGPRYHKGSQWMTLSRPAVERLLEHHATSGLASFFRSTRIPDEAYFQTLLLNDPLVCTADVPTTWARFTDGAPHPHALDAGAVAEAIASGAAFARKVVPGRSDEAVAVIDDWPGPWPPLGSVPTTHDVTHE